MSNIWALAVLVKIFDVKYEDVVQKLKMLEFKVVYFTRFGKYHYCEDLREVISLFSIGPD
ncbi:hypothetical protein J41TS12_00820 [Paenibacillus antibioticophila]|uniref:Uncharacterized protein n=1 Tax=Paenibacillus antibioticophila TaxID=1274374 RepID=A0A919XMZ1_9BACL|nr:hypothetical protein J41TS12_00820 [Paenibacillus antibioticophila]